MIWIYKGVPFQQCNNEKYWTKIDEIEWVEKI